MNTEHTMVHASAVSHAVGRSSFVFWTELQCELDGEDSCPNEPRNTSSQPRRPS